MKLTEEEASKKLCPQSADPNGAWCSCIGSRCMAWRTAYEWRWSDEPNSIWVQGRAPHETATEERVVGGFCGLAGQPQ